jgi:hypothetical protein
MRNFLKIILGLFFLSACFNPADKLREGQRELLPNPEKYQHDGYSGKDSLKPKFSPDTTIGIISLVNSKHIDEYLGENVMDRLFDKGHFNSSIISKDKKQRLTFYFHPGGVKKEFSEFQVEYAKQIKRDDCIGTDEEFVSESNIKLGISIGDLRAIKGEPDSITNKGTSTFYYRLDDMKSSKFLQRYNMPVYYANYEFKDGYLIRFRFGFEYP